MNDLPAAGNQHGSMEWACPEHGRLAYEEIVAVSGRRLCLKCLLRLLDELSVHLGIDFHEARLERTL